MSNTFKAVEDHYRSGSSNISEDFFRPCLASCSRYRRAVGYFSSSALVSWLAALERLANEAEVRFQIIASPNLSERDISALHAAVDEEERRRLEDQLISDFIGEIETLAAGSDLYELYAKIFAWLIANGHLEIKFAFPEHVEDADIFHEKIGVFNFPDGESVAFTGSANESARGHRRNFESIDVYRSWVPEEERRVRTKIEQFDEAWKAVAPGLDVRPLSKDIFSRLIKIAPEERPKPIEVPVPDEVDELATNWAHQDEAIECFLEKRVGILEMATGTGKTRTALRIVERLVSEGKIDSVIITTDGTDLLDQWSMELSEFVTHWDHPFLIYRHFDANHELGDFALGSDQSILVISRGQLPRLFQRLPVERRGRMIIVHDEVHGLGVQSLRDKTAGEHTSFGFRLGLSATPERAYDQAGNDFIENEMGTTIFCFPLEKAIARGILCEFDYETLEYELTDGDRERIASVYRKQAARKHEGNPMSKEEIWTEIAKVYKTAEQKPSVFFHFLKRHPEIINSTIIFVETKEYGNSLLDEIHKYTRLYRTYYAEDDRENLVSFSRGEIDCLITCHRVSQGIDIRSLRNVILFSSARSKLETIQRIGRCLRADPSDPEKRARVIDFVRAEENVSDIPNADDERAAWLSTVSKVKRGDEVVART